MKVVYYWDDGQRTGLLLGTGNKYHKLLVIDYGKRYQGLRVMNIPVVQKDPYGIALLDTEVLYKDKPYPVSRFLKHCRRIIRERGRERFTKSALDAVKTAAKAA